MLENKILDKTAKICVLGLGYVGLPLATAFAGKDFKVYGFDVSKKKIDLILNENFGADNKSAENFLKKFTNKKIFFSSDPDILKNFDVAIICVPTPKDDTLNPDLSLVISALEIASRYLRKDAMVVLESTTFPTTLENIAKPLLEKKSGLTAGKDFYLVSSPERIDPGNKTFALGNIPKVVSGIDDRSTKLASSLYSNVVPKTIEVFPPRVAEATKMLENIFRLVNISLINELAKIFELMDIDTFKVVEATATKPFGYMPFYPSAGAGGHCIPDDPIYMSYIAKKYHVHLDFIETATKINESMWEHVTYLVQLGLNKVGKAVNGARIGVMGFSYKPNVEDIRNAASIEVIKNLKKLDGDVYGFDPHVKNFKHAREIDFHEIFNCDCVLMLVKHDFFKDKKEEIHKLLKQNGAVFIDCVNFFEGMPDDIKYVGLGKPRV